MIKNSTVYYTNNILISLKSPCSLFEFNIFIHSEEQKRKILDCTGIFAQAMLAFLRKGMSPSCQLLKNVPNFEARQPAGIFNIIDSFLLCQFYPSSFSCFQSCRHLMIEIQVCLFFGCWNQTYKCLNFLYLLWHVPNKCFLYNFSTSSNK